MELASSALFAADKDASLHRVYDMLGDCHSQPGSLCFPNPGVVLSAERLEYYLLILL